METPAPTPVSEAPEPAANAVLSISVVDIRPNPHQPRTHFNVEALEELAASIQEKGILQPLIVRKRGDNFEIVAGERRWRAAQRVGMTVVPVIVREFNDQEMLELALIENIQRAELNPVEESRAYRQLIEVFELTQEQVADRVGKSRVSVTNALRLLRLPETILNWIEDSSISAGHAKALLSLESESLQLALCREIMSKGLSVREAEKRVRQIVKAPNPQVKAQQPDIMIECKDLEEKLCLNLGLQVKILPRTNNTGRIEIYYNTLDEFQRVFDHMGISLNEEL